MGTESKITGTPLPREQSHSTRLATFKSDSVPIMVDDRASACITNSMEDFVGKTRCIDQKVKGIAGNAQATCHSTIHWCIEDDDGAEHTLKIKRCYYIATILTRIVSLQHFTQSSGDHNPLPDGAGVITLIRNITLFWQQCCFTKTIPLDPKPIIGSTYSAPGTNKLKAFLAGILVCKEPRVFEMHFIPPDDDDASFHLDDPKKPNKELRESINMAKGQANRQLGKKHGDENPQSSIPAMDTKFVLDDIE